MCRLKAYCLKAKEKNSRFYVFMYFLLVISDNFRRLDGRGHIWTTLIFLKKKALQKDIHKFKFNFKS